MYLVKFDNRNQERIAMNVLQQKVGESVIHSGDKYAITEEQKVRLDNKRIRYSLLNKSS